MDRKLNIEALIEDLGGAACVAKALGVARTAPYGWVKRHYVSSRVLEQLKSAFPEVDINAYFEVIDENEARRST